MGVLISRLLGGVLFVLLIEKVDLEVEDQRELQHEEQQRKDAPKDEVDRVARTRKAHEHPKLPCMPQVGREQERGGVVEGRVDLHLGCDQAHVGTPDLRVLLGPEVDRRAFRDQLGQRVDPLAHFLRPLGVLVESMVRIDGSRLALL